MDDLFKQTINFDDILNYKSEVIDDLTNFYNFINDKKVFLSMYKKYNEEKYIIFESNILSVLNSIKSSLFDDKFIQIEIPDIKNNTTKNINLPTSIFSEDDISYIPGINTNYTELCNKGKKTDNEYKLYKFLETNFYEKIQTIEEKYRQIVHNFKKVCDNIRTIFSIVKYINDKKFKEHDEYKEYKEYKSFFKQGYEREYKAENIISTEGYTVDSDKTLGDIEKGENGATKDNDIFKKVNAFLFGVYFKNIDKEICDNIVFKRPYLLDPIKHKDLKWPWNYNVNYEDPIYSIENNLESCNIPDKRYYSVSEKINKDKFTGIQLRSLNHKESEEQTNSYNKYKKFEKYFYNLISGIKEVDDNMYTYQPIKPDRDRDTKYYDDTDSKFYSTFDKKYNNKNHNYNSILLLNLLKIVSYNHNNHEINIGNTNIGITNFRTNIGNTNIGNTNIQINILELLKYTGSLISFCIENYSELKKREEFFNKYYVRGDSGHEWISNLYLRIADNALETAYRIFNISDEQQEDQKIFLKSYDNFRKRCLKKEIKYWYWGKNENKLDNYTEEPENLFLSFKNILLLFVKYPNPKHDFSKNSIYTAISNIIIKQFLNSEHTFNGINQLDNYSDLTNTVSNIINMIIWILKQDYLNYQDLTKFYIYILSSNNLKSYIFYILYKVSNELKRHVSLIIDLTDKDIKENLKKDIKENLKKDIKENLKKDIFDIYATHISNFNFTEEKTNVNDNVKNLLAQSINSRLKSDNNNKKIKEIIDNIDFQINDSESAIYISSTGKIINKHITNKHIAQQNIINTIINNTINEIIEQKSSEEKSSEEESSEEKSKRQCITRIDINYENICDNTIVYIDCINDIKECAILPEALNTCITNIQEKTNIPLYILKKLEKDIVLVITKVKMYTYFLEKFEKTNMANLLNIYADIQNEL